MRWSQVTVLAHGEEIHLTHRKSVPGYCVKAHYIAYAHSAQGVRLFVAGAVDVELTCFACFACTIRTADNAGGIVRTGEVQLLTRMRLAPGELIGRFDRFLLAACVRLAPKCMGVRAHTRSNNYQQLISRPAHGNFGNSCTSKADAQTLGTEAEPARSTPLPPLPASPLPPPRPLPRCRCLTDLRPSRVS
jgi:hypothetical protein